MHYKIRIIKNDFIGRLSDWWKIPGRSADKKEDEQQMSKVKIAVKQATALDITGA